ncbi:hypothetical protein, partial [Acinetobacter venetianus]|uniref:hypothetical protein n=1 Tax=Acinetobacter venetianus TaxID=52133 RepID=UPI001F4086FD
HLPCESKSSPAFKSKHPLRLRRGGVLYKEFYFKFFCILPINFYFQFVVNNLLSQKVIVKNFI